MLVSRTKTELIHMTSHTFKHKSVGQQFHNTLHALRSTLSIFDIALKLLACDVPAAGHHTTRARKFLGRLPC